MSAAQLVVMAVRPPVAAVVLLFAALGQAAAGRPEALHPLFTTTLAVIACWFVHATTTNDLGDEAVDRVNLAHARGRPLVSGHASRRQLAALGAGSGVVALVLAAVTSGAGAVAVVAAGLALSTAYSSRPLRLCERGGLAVAVLPAGYVAVPYLLGALAVGPLRWSTLALLPGLYVAFVGRIVLKDLRDVDGDAAHGKRTFLLRHGRHATCLLAGAAWVVGATAVAAGLPLRPSFALTLAAVTACALHALVRLADEDDRVAQQVLVGAVAQCGRASGILALAHLTMVADRWSSGGHDLLLLAIGGAFVVSHVGAVADRQVATATVRPW